MPETRQRRIRELDGLRALAVLAVLNCHYLQWYPRLGSSFGWLGVDLFFVLSGYLITGILLELREERHYFRTFYTRRALRILPPYLLGLAVYLAVSFGCGMPGAWQMWLSYLFYYASLLTRFQPAYLHGTMAVPAAVAMGLSVLWSLSVEEIYYTVWAPLVRLLSDKGIACTLALMMVGAPLLRWWLHTQDYREIYTFYCRMDGLAYGSAVALMMRWRRSSPGFAVRWDRLADRLLAAFIALAVVAAAIFGGSPHRLPVASAGVSFADLCFALLTYALVRKAGGAQWWVRVFRVRWLRSVGTVSYSLYLFHFPLYIAAQRLVTPLHLSRRLNAAGAASLGLMMSFAAAYGLWYGMESRILRWKDRKVPRHLPEAELVAS